VELRTQKGKKLGYRPPHFTPKPLNHIPTQHILLSMARNIPFLAGLGLASVIGCYVIFPESVRTVYTKLSGGKEMSKPEKWHQRASLVAKQVTNPVAEVQFYRNIGLFGAAVYLIATQGHQMTVA